MSTTQHGPLRHIGSKRRGVYFASYYSAVTLLLSAALGPAGGVFLFVKGGPVVGAGEALYFGLYFFVMPALILLAGSLTAVVVTPRRVRPLFPFWRSVRLTDIQSIDTREDGWFILVTRTNGRQGRVLKVPGNVLAVPDSFAAGAADQLTTVVANLTAPEPQKIP